MSELISGKEAKLAWANGEIVQWRQVFSWNYLGVMTMLGIFDADDIEFRLKPRTITINGIEVPAPFEPNIGDFYYFISPFETCGYTKYKKWGDCSYGYDQFGAWRTEDEIKQVVAALRKVFKE